jgi:hypothetical protein
VKVKLFESVPFAREQEQNQNGLIFRQRIAIPIFDQIKKETTKPLTILSVSVKDSGSIQKVEWAPAQDRAGNLRCDVEARSQTI